MTVEILLATPLRQSEILCSFLSSGVHLTSLAVPESVEFIFMLPGESDSPRLMETDAAGRTWRDIAGSSFVRSAKAPTENIISKQKLHISTPDERGFGQRNDARWDPAQKVEQSTHDVQMCRHRERAGPEEGLQTRGLESARLDHVHEYDRVQDRYEWQEGEALRLGT